MPTPTLSDGAPCDVRQLGIFELDALPRPALGIFTYTIELKGGPQQAEFDLSGYQEPPSEPPVPEHEAKEGTELWYKWREYHMYHAALLHQKRQIEAVAEHDDAVARYILANCVAAEDVPRIRTTADWVRVYTAALVEELTMEKLAETLRNHLQAEYDGDEVFAALKEVAGGLGRYDAIKLWEGKVMFGLHLTEANYATLSLDERARHVCRLMADAWIEQLEMERMRKEREMEEAARKHDSKAR